MSFKHIFIVGVGRSGTSLLQSMLSSHSDVDFLPETSFIRRYWVTQKMTRLMRSGNLQKLASLVRLDERLSRLSIDLESELNFFAEKSDIEKLESVLYDRICSHELKIKSNFVGDKDPKLIEYQPFISKNFKYSNIIHIIRDPRDVLLSKKNAEWSKHRHVWLHIFAWRVQLELGFKYLNDANLRYFELRYENLISSPEDTLSALCNFLGLSYQPAMLNFSTNNQRFVAAEEFSWKKEVLQPLNQVNMNKWGNHLSDREIVLIEKFCSYQINRYDYKKRRHFGTLSIKDKLWVLTGYLFLSCLLLPYKYLKKGS